MYSGWELSRQERLRLYSYIPAIYGDTFPHFIVHQFKCDQPPIATSGDVVGSFDNKEGEQALIFSIDGSTVRPDGRIYHLSWSRDHVIIGRKPFHSNHPFIVTDWLELDQPISVQILPTVVK